MSRWIIRKFFEDSRPFLYQAPRIDAELDTLNLETADPALLQELKELVVAVIEANRCSQGSSFADSGAFPIYMEKLAELSHTIEFPLNDAEP